MSTIEDATGRPARRVVRFLAVGAASYMVDILVFNALAYGPGGGVMHDRPITAKVISTLVSALVSFYGNKWWTFDDHSANRSGRQVLVFIAVNLVAWGILLAPLAFSRYVLGLDGFVADNLSGNVVGLGAALVFRFWAYRRWVFPAPIV